MSFKNYIPNQDQWESHFKNKKTITNFKKFYTLKPPKQIKNVESVTIVSPTAQGLSMAELEVKRKYEELLENNPFMGINTNNKRKKYQSTVRKRADKK